MEDKTIRFTIVIQPHVVKRLQTALNVRMMSGTHSGLIESFVYRILQQIEEGSPEYSFTLKKEID